MIPDRVSAIEVAEKLRLPQMGNVMTEIDMTLTPYLKQPMELIGDTRVQWLFALAPTQSGKTVLLQTAVADMIDQDPGPCLYILPDEVSGKKHIQEKVVDVIKATPCLSEHSTGYVRDMSKQGIKLDNMHIHLGWSNSLATISSFPQKRVILDEIRLMKLEVGKESNAIQLAEDRLTTYTNAGIGQGLGVSTPSVKGDLLSHQLDIYGTTVWSWQVPCPVCGEFQYLTMDNLKFNRKEERGVCLCKYCSCEFMDGDSKRAWNNEGMYVRRMLNEAGEWEDTKVVDGVPEKPFKVTKRMVFWWNSFVSPFRSFHQIWRKHIETKDKLHDRKNFVQGWLAEFWIEDISKTSAIKLREHCIGYQKGDVPNGSKVLTAGIDTQDDGFYVAVRAWGAEKFTGLVDEYFIACDMATASVNDIRLAFYRDVFERIYIGEEGKWKVALCAIDTGGHRTKEIYTAAAHFPRMVMVKGRNNQNITISYNKELALYLIRTCEYLDESEERCVSSNFVLPNNVSTDYLTQFCNMRKVRNINKKTGETKVEWIKTGKADYRMADVHAFICLDIDTDLGKFRYEIEKANFKLRVHKDATKVRNISRKSNYDPAFTNSQEQENDFISTDKEWL